MTEKDSKAYMYVVECADGTLYTGYTTDVERRLKTCLLYTSDAADEL